MLSYYNTVFSTSFRRLSAGRLKWKGLLAFGLLLCLLVSPTIVFAAFYNVYEWEWIDPADHSLGKQQSTTFVPDGNGVRLNNASNKDLTLAYLIGFSNFNRHGDPNPINIYFSTLANADLSGSDWYSVTMDSVNFTGANLTGAAFRYSSNLLGSNFTNANLTNAYMDGYLGSATFNGAEIGGASLPTSFTSSQLYSTANYQAGDLTGISLTGDLTGWSFVGQNLTDTKFIGATLTNADFSGADARSAISMNVASSMTHNFIHPDGHVTGLDITAGEEMRLWDFNLATPVPILIQDTLSIDSTGTLRAVLEDDDWGSTLTFDAGIGVSLDGTLELLVDSREGSNVSSMVGVTFDLFDWTGVTPSGTFTQITTADGLVWDLSDLYSMGEVTLLSAPSVLFADFDDNGTVDEADLDAWRAAFGSTTDLDADGNGDGVIDAADYTVWRDNFVAASAAVPEPTALLLTLLGVASCGWYGRRR